MKKTWNAISSFISDNDLSSIVVVLVLWFAYFQVYGLFKIIIGYNNTEADIIHVSYRLLLLLGYVEVLRKKIAGAVLFYLVMFSKMVWHIMHFNEYTLSYLLVGAFLMIAYALLLCVKKNGKSAWHCLKGGL